MIKGSTEYITSLKNNLTSIENDILELEQSIEKLELKIDTKNEFKIDTIKKNKTIQSEISMLKTALNRAYKKRDEIVKDNADNTYKDVKALIGTFKSEQLNSANDKNLSIIQKVEEIRQLHDEIKIMDKEVHTEIQQFIEEVGDFLDPEPKDNLVLFGEAQEQKGYLKYTNGYSVVGNTTFVNEINERVLGIERGLYNPLSMQQDKINEIKESMKG